MTTEVKNMLAQAAKSPMDALLAARIEEMKKVRARRAELLAQAQAIQNEDVNLIRTETLLEGKIEQLLELGGRHKDVRIIPGPGQAAPAPAKVTGARITKDEQGRTVVTGSGVLEDAMATEQKVVASASVADSAAPAEVLVPASAFEGFTSEGTPEVSVPVSVVEGFAPVAV